MSASALECDPALTEKHREEMGMIRHHIELEARLIDDLLDLTRVTRGKIELQLEPVDAHTLLREAIQTCCQSDIHTKGLQVHTDFGAAQPFIQADPARFQQVLWNVLKNAVKFTPAGGTITVRTSNVGADLAITIADTGIGIAPERLPWIFDAFEQGDRMITRRFGGLGLGLAISKALIDLHHGTLSAASDGNDRGATFTITMATVPGAPRGALSDDQVGLHRRLRILLVEDHKTTARVMARLLGDCGHEVQIVNTIGSASEAMQDSPFDLLISDLGLPDGTGLELMKRAAREHGLKGIALSGYGMDDDVQRSRAAGFAAHLTKPIDFRKLQATINQVFSH